MIARALSLLTLGSALGCGLVAGVFFAFSNFVMPALAKLPPAQGVAAMQSINVVVLNRWFLGLFVGTAVACLSLAIASIAQWSAPGAGLRLAGGALYVVGTFIVTAAGNVPRNDALAAFAPQSPEAAAYWPRYVDEWSRWNHVRTAAAFGAAALLTASLLRGARG